MLLAKDKAYAKINLGLKTLGKRDDGYHELEMLMVNINIYDDLYFYKSDKIEVLMDTDACKMEDNLVYKAVKLLKEKYNVSSGIKIRIKKHIPDGGGLGGGSSDAACALKTLNIIWNLKLSIDELKDIAIQIGCDVVFFLYNTLSIVKGKGEIVEPVNIDLEENLTLVIPDIKCSTKEIYKNHIIEKNNKEIKDIVNNLEKDYYNYMFNDLEVTASKVYPKYCVYEIIENMEKIGYKKAMMSGSGSTIFGIGSNNKIIRELKKLYKKFYIVKCKTISSCK